MHTHRSYRTAGRRSLAARRHKLRRRVSTGAPLANREAKAYKHRLGFANANFLAPQVLRNYGDFAQLPQIPGVRTQMRGVFCDGAKISLRRDLAKPGPAAGEIVLKVRLAGICDTDLQIAKGYMGFRGILGHEFVAENPSGQRFVAEINAVCHHCDFCRSGMTRHCPHRTVLGILGRDGAMADFVRVPVSNLHQIPDSIDDLQAVFVEPLAAAFRMIEQISIEPGQTIAILGDGKLGLLCAWVARTTGAAVTLVGKHPEKLALAGDGIATKVLDPARLGVDKFDVVADCTGSASGLETVLRLVRPCGTVVLKTTIAGDHAISLAAIVIDEIRVLGSRCGPFPPAIEALARGIIDVRPLIAAEFPLDDAERAYQAASERGARKILLRIS